jgi:hypothetical protein
MKLEKEKHILKKKQKKKKHKWKRIESNYEAQL